MGSRVLGREDMSSCHPVLGPLHTHSHLQGLLPRGRGQSSGALDWTGSPVTCTSWKFTNVPGTIERCLACLEEATPPTLFIITQDNDGAWIPMASAPWMVPRYSPFPLALLAHHMQLPGQERQGGMLSRHQGLTS